MCWAMAAAMLSAIISVMAYQWRLRLAAKIQPSAPAATKYRKSAENIRKRGMKNRKAAA